MATLNDAIESGDLEILKQALKDDARNINNAAPNGEYPIHKAAKARAVKMVQMLIDAGANINQASEESGSMKGYTAAHYAARNGDVDMILLLAKNKADFNREANDHWSPIHCAAFSGKRLVMLALLDNGAKVDAKNQHGQTALVYAANHGRVADVRELLSRGASLVVADPNGDSLLHCTFHYQMQKLFEGEYEMPDVQLDVAVVLAIAGAEVDAKNHEGNTADFYLKDDIPSFTSVLKILAANKEKFQASKTEWNYMTLLSAKVEHYLGIGLEIKHAMDLYENITKADSERKAAKKRREEERPAGGCPVMKGKKKPAGAAAGGAPSGHPSVEDVKNMDPNGPDPSGGQCPFFKKKDGAAAAPAPAPVAAPPAASYSPVEKSSTAAAAPSAVAAPAPQHVAAAVAPKLDWAFVFENRTTILMMVLCFFLGILFEQWSNRLLGRGRF